ncbi:MULTISPECIES: TIGR02117 family protein [unclassified Aureimonas]|uniref:TIGR02117 family protein n=1 Tax=unclassified Aureimonas TaxID=2615206 RepID=UPI0006F81136|nr:MULTISPECIES: TIGR02117 family protein [unclassified Aureimonas]KQT65780.1 hypothetical protein ASG62_21655 [Aureimonas sp. Leaf427]KQT74779.1 hypothetical protein ASG54_16715 [Aureimonas sp. Leaf460]
MRTRIGLAAAALTLALALALGTLIRLGPSGPPAQGSGAHHILVLANAIHTDIALPVDAALLARFAFLQAAGLPAERADWLLVGRGGRSFYVETPTWSDLRPWPVVKSFTLDDAVMHVGLAGPLREEDKDTSAFTLDDAAYEALLSAIEESFAATTPIPGAGYGPYDRFFEATGRFNAVAGCNVWTAATLRRAGIATGLWTPLPQLLRWSLELHGGEASGSPGP